MTYILICLKYFVKTLFNVLSLFLILRFAIFRRID